MAELQRAWAAHMRDGFTVAAHQFEIEAGLVVVASAGWLWQVINRHEVVCILQWEERGAGESGMPPDCKHMAGLRA
jgi:hypothetical protein